MYYCAPMEYVARFAKFFLSRWTRAYLDTYKDMQTYTIGMEEHMLSVRNLKWETLLLGYHVRDRNK